MKFYKLLIVGAGPSGISLAVEGRNAGLDQDEILMIDKAESHSWVIRSMYPDKKIVTANYKGNVAVCHGTMCLRDSTKQDTISYLDNAIEKTGVKVHYKEEVLKIEKHHLKEIFDVITNKSHYLAKIVVIAIGVFGKPNKPSFPLPIKLKSRIHFDLSDFIATDENILVVGGGDSASEFAQYLVESDNNVTLSYRGDGFHRMNEFNKSGIKEDLRSGKLKLRMSSNIEKVEVSDNEKPLVFFKEKPRETCEYDHIVFALGGTTPENFLRATGIEFSDDSPNIGDSGETQISGLFIGGDLLAGKKGGSIAHAFNSSKFTMEKICKEYLNCISREKKIEL